MPTNQEIQALIDIIPQGTEHGVTAKMLIDIYQGLLDKGVEKDEAIDLLQSKLISGENIKTINGESILGSGNIVISASGSPSENDDDAIIHIILTGQSNADGRGLNSQATTEEKAIQSSCEIWNPATSAYEDLNIGGGNNNNTAFGKHGIELGLAKYFQNYFPNRKLRLIKKTQGGTQMTYHLTGGTVYTPCWNDNVKPAINQTISEGKKAEVYLVFIQGEADSEPQSLVDAYAGKLSTWYNLWKSNLSAKLWVRQVQIIESDTMDPQINAMVKSLAFASQNYDYIVAKDEPSGDNLHYNYAALKTISQRVLKDMKLNRSTCIIREALGNVTTPPPPPPASGAKLKLSHTNLDYILLDTPQNFVGEFDLEFKINIQSEAGSNYVTLFAGGTEATNDPCRFLMSPSQNRMYLQIGTETAYLNGISIEFNQDITLRVYRDTSNQVYAQLNAGTPALIGDFTNPLKVSRFFNSNIWNSGNFKKFDGFVDFVHVGTDEFIFDEGTGTIVTGGTLTGAIESSGNLSYVNNTIWL